MLAAFAATCSIAPIPARTTGDLVFKLEPVAIPNASGPLVFKYELKNTANKTLEVAMSPGNWGFLSYTLDGAEMNLVDERNWPYLERPSEHLSVPIVLAGGSVKRGLFLVKSTEGPRYKAGPHLLTAKIKYGVAGVESFLEARSSFTVVNADARSEANTAQALVTIANQGKLAAEDQSVVVEALCSGFSPDLKSLRSVLFHPGIEDWVRVFGVSLLAQRQEIESQSLAREVYGDLAKGKSRWADTCKQILAAATGTTVRP